jgi:hypothetical protein
MDRGSPLPRPGRLLRTSLRANAAFSAVCGVGMLAAAGPSSVFLGVPEPRLVSLVGASLLGFSGLLLFLASRPRVHLPSALGIVGLDLAWVIGSAWVLLASVLTVAGNWTVALVADVVLLFALLQYLGVRRLRRAES